MLSMIPLKNSLPSLTSKVKPSICLLPQPHSTSWIRDFAAALNSPALLLAGLLKMPKLRTDVSLYLPTLIHQTVLQQPITGLLLLMQKLVLNSYPFKNIKAGSKEAAHRLCKSVPSARLSQLSLQKHQGRLPRGCTHCHTAGQPVHSVP